MAQTVYLLFHIRPSGQLLLLGAYPYEEDAKEAIQRLKDKPGFVDYPEGFEYHDYELGVEVEQWKEGFTEDQSDDPDGGEGSSGSSDEMVRPNRAG